MQYHFMLMFDDETKSWSVDTNTFNAVMTDGVVYNPNTYPGWFWPEEDSPEEALEYSLYNMLRSSLDTLPVPQEA